MLDKLLLEGVSAIATSVANNQTLRNCAIGAAVVAGAALNAAVVIGVYEYGGQACKAVAEGCGAAIESVGNAITQAFFPAPQPQPIVVSTDGIAYLPGDEPHFCSADSGEVALF